MSQMLYVNSFFNSVKYFFFFFNNFYYYCLWKACMWLSVVSHFSTVAEHPYMIACLNVAQSFYFFSFVCQSPPTPFSPSCCPLVSNWVWGPEWLSMRPFGWLRKISFTGAVLCTGAGCSLDQDGGHLRHTSQKPWELFSPVKLFSIHLYLKTEKCICLKLLVQREPLFILRTCG